MSFALCAFYLAPVAGSEKKANKNKNALLLLLLYRPLSWPGA
jgi:hypothetical protein